LSKTLLKDSIFLNTQNCIRLSEDTQFAGDVDGDDDDYDDNGTKMDNNVSSQNYCNQEAEATVVSGATFR
jgi:hypothetical protein